jgi:hypothetical protein
MNIESPQERTANFPRWIQERITSCPAKGQAVHSWLFRTAWPLHEWFSKDEIGELLPREFTSRTSRKKPGETLVCVKSIRMRVTSGKSKGGN